MSEEIDSRTILRKCFNCKNNIQCWHLNDNIPTGKNPRTMKINQFSLIKHFLRAQRKGLLKTGLGLELYTIRTLLNTFNPHYWENKTLSVGYTTQIMAVLEMFSNCPQSNWCCPGEEEGNPESYKYDPIRTDIEVTVGCN
jgi:hypothetical protein